MVAGAIARVLCLVSAVYSRITVCPVSGQFDTALDSFLPYPRYYFPPVSPTYRGPPFTDYNCSISESNTKTCCAHFCPVHACYADEGYAATTWLNRGNRLCHLLYPNITQAAPSETVNVVFLGGSMTAGSGTGISCCCHSELDPKCLTPPSECGVYNTHGDDNFCAWPGFFFRFLQKRFPAIQFRFVSLAGTGMTSAFGAESIEELLAQRLITLRAQDIVFLDYSVNDAEAADVDRSSVPEAHRRRVQLGLEALVRRLFYLSEGRSPSIVVVEQFPHSAEYVPVYRQVAQHYGLPLWSYRTALLSSCFAKASPRAAFYFEASARAQLSHPTHPPFFGHLFVADVLAQVLLLGLDECVAGDPLGEEHYAMPPRLFNDSANEPFCLHALPLLVDAFADSDFTPDDLELFEGPEQASVGWRQYIDHHAPGWIINKYAEEEYRALAFPFATDALLPLNMLLEVVKISYLETYSDAGVVDVVLCGRSLGSIDALAADFRARHVSVPQFFWVLLTSDQVSVCASIEAGDRRLELVYRAATSRLVDERADEKVKILTVSVCAHAVYDDANNL